MSLPTLALAYHRAGVARDNVARIWRLLAYVARYGHQPLASLLVMPMTQVRAFADALEGLLKEEGGPLDEMGG